MKQLADALKEGGSLSWRRKNQLPLCTYSALKRDLQARTAMGGVCSVSVIAHRPTDR
jgi:hypothetical protein